MTSMVSNKTVSETLTALRTLFNRYEIEEWEPIRSETDLSYAVRYRTAGQWIMIGSYSQSTRAKNLRQCYQVIQYHLLWASRGVTGISQGVTFIHGGLVKVGPDTGNESLEVAYATIGVDSIAGLEEIGALYRTKMKFNHPDGINDPEEKRQKEERCKRLNEAWGLVQKARGSK